MQLSNTPTSASPLPAWTQWPELPTPFCPAEPVLASEAALQRSWMQSNAPVLVQPSFDCAHGNEFLACFYHFHRTTCVLSLVYTSEASYSSYDATRVNSVGTAFYRSHNYRVYHRTADINHLALHHCNLTPASSESAYQSLHTTDYPATQRWNKGDKGSLLWWNFMHHYDLEIDRDACRPFTDDSEKFQSRMRRWRDADRAMHEQRLSQQDRLKCVADDIAATNTDTNTGPHRRVVLFVTTCNHQMSPFDTNAEYDWSVRVHSQYAMFPGDRALAEKFSQCCIADKWTIWTMLPCFNPRPRHLQSERQNWRHLHHSKCIKGTNNDKCDGTEARVVGDVSGAVIADVSLVR